MDQMMKPALVMLCSFVLAACGSSTPVSTKITTNAVPSQPRTQTIPPSKTSTFEPTRTQVAKTLPPAITSTPWILPSGLSIEEHPLTKMPEIEPLVIHPMDGSTQAEVLQKHASLWGETLPPNAYYSVGHGSLWVMQGSDKLEAVEGPVENGQVTAQVTSNGKVVFSKSITPPGVTSEFRVLDVYGSHWVLELAKAKTNQADSFFAGEIFVDGQSLNDLLGYEDSFDFQTINGRPFYFFKRGGKIGVAYDGLEIPLNYDGVFHYGCCSAGALNPRIAQNITGFFAWRGGDWYYTEIGIFDQP